MSSRSWRALNRRPSPWSHSNVLRMFTAGEAGGALCEDRLRWIDRALAAAPGRPTLVLMHHPPFATGIAPTAPDESRFPVAALSVIPAGPGLFNHYDWGGWLIWHAPATPVPPSARRPVLLSSISNGNGRPS